MAKSRQTNKPLNQSVNNSMNNNSVNKSNSRYKSHNDSSALHTEDVDMEIKSGEENIDEDDIVDESEYNLNLKAQEKKN